jgi:hypothetical protein
LRLRETHDIEVCFCLSEEFAFILWFDAEIFGVGLQARATQKTRGDARTVGHGLTMERIWSRKQVQAAQKTRNTRLVPSHTVLKTKVSG